MSIPNLLVPGTESTFDSVEWSAGGLSSYAQVLGTVVAYDFTNTAERLNEGDGANVSSRRQSISIPLNTLPYLARAKVKKTIGATNFPAIDIRLYVDGSLTRYASVIVNTNAGTITYRNTWFVPDNMGIQDRGDHYLVWVAMKNNGACNGADIFISPAFNNDASGSPSLGATGESTWCDAGIEQAMVPYEYYIGAAFDPAHTTGSLYNQNLDFVAGSSQYSARVNRGYDASKGGSLWWEIDALLNSGNFSFGPGVGITPATDSFDGSGAPGYAIAPNAYVIFDDGSSSITYHQAASYPMSGFAHFGGDWTITGKNHTIGVNWRVADGAIDVYSIYYDGTHLHPTGITRTLCCTITGLPTSGVWFPFYALGFTGADASRVRFNGGRVGFVSQLPGTSAYDDVTNVLKWDPAKSATTGITFSNDNHDVDAYGNGPGSMGTIGRDASDPNGFYVEFTVISSGDGFTSLNFGFAKDTWVTQEQGGTGHRLGDDLDGWGITTNENSYLAEQHNSVYGGYSTGAHGFPVGSFGADAIGKTFGLLLKNGTAYLYASNGSLYNGDGVLGGISGIVFPATSQMGVPGGRHQVLRVNGGDSAFVIGLPLGATSWDGTQVSAQLQTVQPSSIASAESFGTPRVLLPQFIQPAPIASAESFGTPSVAFAPPRINSTPIQWESGDVVDYQIVATNNPISYAASGLPASLGINALTGVITGILSDSDIGVYDVVLTVANAYGQSQIHVNISVNDSAAAPFALLNNLGQAVDVDYLDETGQIATLTLDPVEKRKRTLSPRQLTERTWNLISKGHVAFRFKGEVVSEITREEYFAKHPEL